MTDIREVRKAIKLISEFIGESEKHGCITCNNYAPGATCLLTKPLQRIPDDIIPTGCKQYMNSDEDIPF